MADLKLTNVEKAYGEVKVLANINLDIKQGELIVFVGPSGCGKSTLLRMIAGLERISGGELQIDGIVVNDVPPAQRGIAMVFQSYALYPHMTVRENMEFALKIAKKTKEQIAAGVDKAAKILQLTPYLDRLPKALSGGQRQRVAIGRAIVREPDVFLFDEPLSNLDAALRVQMRIEIGKLHNDLKSTMIYVTHDQVEAMTMADKIVVLHGGIIEQVGSPLELYHRPRNMFVAGFIGSPKMNFIPVTVQAARDGNVMLSLPGDGRMTIPMKGDLPAAGTRLTLGCRPEHVAIGKEAAASGALQGTIRVAEYLGSETMFYASLADGTEIAVKGDGLAAQKSGDILPLSLPAAACHLFDAQSNAILNGDLTR